jgi:hypothetical protein
LQDSSGPEYLGANGVYTWERFANWSRVFGVGLIWRIAASIIRLR